MGARLAAGLDVSRFCLRPLYSTLLITITGPSLLRTTLPTQEAALGACIRHVVVRISPTLQGSLLVKKSLSPVDSSTARRCSSFQNGGTPMIIHV